MTTPTDNAALTQALAEYEAAQYILNTSGTCQEALHIERHVADTADALIRALQADSAAKTEGAGTGWYHVEHFQRGEWVTLYQERDARKADLLMRGLQSEQSTQERFQVHWIATQPADGSAAPILYELDFDAYADWYRQTTGRDTPFEPRQFFTIERNMGNVASEDYVYVQVASVPGCSMPRRFLKAWAPEPDDAAEG